MKFKISLLLLSLTALLALGGCASYQTPGAGINVGDLSKQDPEIASAANRQPSAPFPSRIAIVRIEAPGYFSASGKCAGQGIYCVVNRRDIESPQDVDSLSRLPNVASAVYLDESQIPPRLTSIADLRTAAAKVGADILLVYSLNTRFVVDGQKIDPLQVISLGILPNKNAQLSSTASAAIYDVQTGFVYGSAGSTATEDERHAIWSNKATVENVRQETETRAFHQFVQQFANVWQNITDRFANRPRD